MTQLLEQRTWNPVQLGGSNKGYTINSYAVSSSWYSTYLDNSGSRRIRLMRYDEMDIDSVEISKALDILAEDISSSNADDEDQFQLKFDENEKYLKSTIKLLESAKDIWKDRTDMDAEFFNRVRDVLKYGIGFYFKKSDGGLRKLYPEKMVGYILDENDEEIVTHYIYDPTLPRIEERNRSVVKTNQGGKAGSQDNYETYSVNDLVILKVGDGPFGKSVLERVFKTWRQMTLIEDAIVIYRVTRAPERRVYYIDTGNLQGPKREQAIERQRLRLMQKNINKQNNLSTEYDPHSTSEDIFIPTNSQGKGSRIETLQGGQSLGETRDLQWFAQKLAAGLRIPHSMIDVHGEQMQQPQYNDMRVGQLYQIELRYLGYVKRIQRMFAFELHDHFTQFCKNREVIVPETVMLTINAPNSFAEYKDIEVNQARMNVAASSLSFQSLSKKYVLQEYMGLDEEAIIKNEIEKLKELGIDEEMIKDMPDSDVSNLVYAEQKNPEIMKKYGLSSEEGAGGKFGF